MEEKEIEEKELSSVKLKILELILCADEETLIDILKALNTKES